MNLACAEEGCSHQADRRFGTFCCHKCVVTHALKKHGTKPQLINNYTIYFLWWLAWFRTFYVICMSLIFSYTKLCNDAYWIGDVCFFESYLYHLLTYYIWCILHIYAFRNDLWSFSFFATFSKWYILHSCILFLYHSNQPPLLKPGLMASVLSKEGTTTESIAGKPPQEICRKLRPCTPRRCPWRRGSTCCRCTIPSLEAACQ